MGATLRQIVFDIGGGIPRDREFKAAQMGGPSGGCVPAQYLDLSIDYDSVEQVGAIMGSGGLIVMDEDTCMVEIARFFTDFVQKESCGKCVPCRLGTRRMLEILTRITTGEGEPADIDRLERLGRMIKRASLCGLGQTAPNPTLSTIRYFRDEYEAHIAGGRCPAGECVALTTFAIDPELCICCGRCAKNCPVDCISGKRGKPPGKATEADREKGKVGEPFCIDQEVCIKCGTCFDVCPAEAVKRA
jgi:NADP-reducing hydrogenase subunit HndC